MIQYRIETYFLTENTTYGHFIQDFKSRAKDMEAAESNPSQTLRKTSRDRPNREAIRRKSEKRTEKIKGTVNVLRATMKFSTFRSVLCEFYVYCTCGGSKLEFRSRK